MTRKELVFAVTQSLSDIDMSLQHETRSLYRGQYHYPTAVLEISKRIAKLVELVESLETDDLGNPL